MDTGLDAMEMWMLIQNATLFAVAQGNRKRRLLRKRLEESVVVSTLCYYDNVYVLFLRFCFHGMVLFLLLTFFVTGAFVLSSLHVT